jgi:hypothetical protein
VPARPAGGHDPGRTSSRSTSPRRSGASPVDPRCACSAT